MLCLQHSSQVHLPDRLCQRCALSWRSPWPTARTSARLLLTLHFMPLMSLSLARQQSPCEQAGEVCGAQAVLGQVNDALHDGDPPKGQVCRHQ